MGNVPLSFCRPTRQVHGQIIAIAKRAHASIQNASTTFGTLGISRIIGICGKIIAVLTPAGEPLLGHFSSLVVKILHVVAVAIELRR
jgi:hypothetical protein